MRITSRAKKNWTAGRGALWIIAVMFLLSAIIRIGMGAGPALAREVAALRTAEDLALQPERCEGADDIAEILTALSNRQEFLDAREATLEELEQTLTVSEIELRKNLDTLENLEQRLAATMAKSQAAAEGDLARLTSVYENMKPKDASTLFEAMQPEFAAGFVGRMRPDAAAQILAGLTPETAYTISVLLAGRNAFAPKE